MNPTPGDIFVSRPLTTIANNYMANAGGFVADTVFPIIPVDDQAGMYFELSRGDWFRVDAHERAPATETVGTGYRVTNRPVYNCRVYGVHTDVDDQTRAVQANIFDLDKSATELVSQDVMLLREQKWANSFFTTGIWGTDRAGVNSGVSGSQFLRWDVTNSTPVTDIRRQATTMARTQGFRPNVLLLGNDVYDVLQEHPQIIDRIKYNDQSNFRGIVDDAALARLFNVDRIIIPQAIINSGAEGAADSFDFIYGKSALLAYANPNPNIMQPSAGYIFAWRGYLGANAFGARIKRFRMENIASDRVEAEMAFDMKVVTPALGVFWSSAVS